MVLDLKIYQPDRIPCPAGRLGHEFETDRLKSQKDLGVMEDPGENTEKPHNNPPLAIVRRSRQPSVPRLMCQPTRQPLEHETLSSRQAITSHGCSRNNDELAERLIEPFAGTTKYENEGAF